MLRREPYVSFMHLRAKSKIRCFRALRADQRIPFPVKVIPVLTVIYLAMPLDLVPDFIPVLGYMDDVGIVVLALAAILRCTPRLTDIVLFGIGAEELRILPKCDRQTPKLAVAVRTAPW